MNLKRKEPRALDIELDIFAASAQANQAHIGREDSVEQMSFHTAYEVLPSQLE